MLCHFSRGSVEYRSLQETEIQTKHMYTHKPTTPALLLFRSKWRIALPKQSTNKVSINITQLDEYTIHTYPVIDIQNNRESFVILQLKQVITHTLKFISNYTRLNSHQIPTPHSTWVEESNERQTIIHLLLRTLVGWVGATFLILAVFTVKERISCV